MTETDVDIHSQLCIEPWDPSGRVRRRAEGAEEDCKLIGSQTVSTDGTLQSSQGLYHQPKSIYGLVHGSCYICSRGLSCVASVGGKVLG